MNKDLTNRGIRSFMIIQDTHLFAGTVMGNIRYAQSAGKKKDGIMICTPAYRSWIKRWDMECGCRTVFSGGTCTG